MNLFNDAVLPNMDTVCVTVGSTTTCSVPWDYYKAGLADLLLFAIGFALIYTLITRAR